VVVTGATAYVMNSAPFSPSDSAIGLWTIDVSDAHHPYVLSHYRGVSHYSPSTILNAIAKMDELILMTQPPSGGPPVPLEIIDVRDPARPTHVGFLNGTYTPYRIAVKGCAAYVITVDGGLKIVDCRDPTSP